MLTTQPDYSLPAYDIVRSDLRTADVFRRYGIDPAEKNLGLRDVCLLKGIGFEGLVRELNKATKSFNISTTLPFETWKVAFLIDYIVNVHHAYLRLIIPEIQEGLENMERQYGNTIPELSSLSLIFKQLSTLMLQHSRHEEEIVFPYIKQIDHAFRHQESFGSLFVRTLRKPLKIIDNEHVRIQTLMEEMRLKTNNYSLLKDYCVEDRLLCENLKELDTDILQHMHLEDDVLFLRAIEIEAQLLKLGEPI